MRQKYHDSTKVKIWQLHALREDMKIEEFVYYYFARSLAIANKMNPHGEKLTHVRIVQNILRSLTLRFNYVVWFKEELYVITTMSVDELPVHKQNICDHKDEDQVQKVFNAGWGYAHNRDRDRGR